MWLRSRPRTATALALAGVCLAGSGCGSSAGEVDPSGIDGLRVPRTTLAAGDFEASVDSPWFPLAPGNVWTYRATGSADSRGTVEVEVEVLPDGGTVHGISTTAVRTTTDAETHVDEYAQDRSGNVWWMARQGEWRAGAPAGGEVMPGLAWPATPRVGDGWLRAEVPGAGKVLEKVLDRDLSADTPAGRFTGLVLSATTTGTTPGRVTRTWWRRGTGPVRWETPRGVVLDLVSCTLCPATPGAPGTAGTPTPGS